MEVEPTTYNFELWSSAGVILADITQMTQEREYTLSRNAAMQITFQVDWTAFETFCASIGENPTTLLAPYQTDVKIKRNGEYIGEACQVTGLEFNLEPNDSGVNPETGSYNNTTTITETITVTAIGYLNILTDRYLTLDYSNEDSCLIAVDLVNQAQLMPHGNFGLTIPGGQYQTGYLYSPTYTQQNVLDELGNLTQIPGGLFDIWIDTDKVLHTSALQGNLRNDLQLTYGGPGSNVSGFYHQRTAAGALYNEIIGMGSGFGSDGLTSIQDNSVSIDDYYLRQKIVTFNNVTDADQLAADVAAEVSLDSGLLDIPQIVVNGSLLSGLPFIGAGDRIKVNFPTHELLSNLDGTWMRVESMAVTVDDNDFDVEITLTLDSVGFTQGQ
jgi:hypothetical protein